MLNMDRVANSLRTVARLIVPDILRELRGKIIRANARTERAIRKANREFNRNSDLQFANKSPKEVFTAIYENKLWGQDESSEFYSGSGSHDDETVRSYVHAIQSFLAALPYTPDAVDLGCGDFFIGSQIRGMCKQYIACDVVAPLIERNRIVHETLNVDFRCLDMCEDPLPAGDVVFVRQVFQHLSNQQVLSVVQKLAQYKVAIITEGLPARKDFVANEDKPIGDGVRFQREVSSGIVVTLPPFNLAHRAAVVLCEVPCGDAVIRTIAYHLQ